MAQARGKAETPNVNLLPEGEWEGRPGGDFLKWALSWGKRIIVVTEGIVILAFLSRFWLDTTLADLAEKIGQKKQIVAGEANFERQWRFLLARVNKVAEIEKLVSPLYIYDRVRALIPSGVAVDNITVSGKAISMTAKGDEAGLSQLVAAFKDSEEFTDLDVARVSKTGGVVGADLALTAGFVTKR